MMLSVVKTLDSPPNFLMTRKQTMRKTVLAAALLGLAFTTLVPQDASAQDAERKEIERRPGYQMPLEKAHPSWTVERAHPEGFKSQTGAIAFSPDGKYMAVTTFESRKTGTNLDRNGVLYIFANPTSKDQSGIVVHKISEDLMLPLGASWTEDGLFILDRWELSKWTDANGDGLPEKKESFASGWISDNFHHFSFGLPYHDGYFYGTLSTSLHLSQEERDTIKPNPKDPIAGAVSNSKGKTLGGNAPNPENRGTLMKINAKTGEIEYIAGGLRTPNGVGIGPKGIVLAPDNQGDFKPSNGIYVSRGKGEFFGKYNSTASHINMPDGGVPSLYSEKEPTPPAIWLPQNEVGNSPSATLLIPEGMPFAGQVLSADITEGAVHRVFMEEVDGTWQGAAFRHTMGFDAGPNDLAWGPDGCLYVGCMGAGFGDWGWTNRKTGEKTKFGLHRLRPTGKVAFEFEKIEATTKGYRVTFTKPAKKALIADATNWIIDAYTYEAKPFYGGPKRDQHAVTVKQVVVSDNGKTAELVIGDRKPNYVYHIRIDAESTTGEKMWSPESWVTFHKAPKAAN